MNNESIRLLATILTVKNKMIIINNNSNHNNNSSNNDNILMESWGYNLAAFVLLLIGIFGFSFNLFVIVLMCKDVKLWSPMNIILFNLVCSDFSVSIFGNPITLTASISQKWIFGRKICIAYGFFMALLGITSITTLTVLAYERFCMITYSLSSKPFNRCGAIILVIFIWLYSLSLTTPPLFGWGAYVNEAANISCSVNWESKSYNATSYIVFLFIFGLVIPVIIISYSYIKIILTMKQSSYRLGRTNTAEKRITWMVAIMILAFLIAWTPYATFALIEQFGPKNLISPAMGVLPALIAKSSICYNPLIYVGLNTQFRDAWKRRTHKESTTIIDTSIRQITTQPKDSNDSETTNNFKCTSNLMKQSKEIFTKRKLSKLNCKKLNDDKDNDNYKTENYGNNVIIIGNNDKNELLLMNNEIMKRKNSLKNYEKHELCVFTDGKLSLIKNNSYNSNICE